MNHECSKGCVAIERGGHERVLVVRMPTGARRPRREARPALASLAGAASPAGAAVRPLKRPGRQLRPHGV